jgi:hypothetical protein
VIKKNNKTNKQKTERNQWGEMSKQTKTPGTGAIEFQS